MQNIRKHIGSRIRQIRATNKLTQAQLAEKLAVSPATVSGWEIGDYGISLESALNLAEYAEVSLDWLVKGHEVESREMTTDTHTPEELRMLTAFSRLSKTSQSSLLRIIETMQK